MRCLNGSFDVAVCDGENRSEADGLQAVNSAFKVTFRAHSMGRGGEICCKSSLWELQLCISSAPNTIPRRGPGVRGGGDEE